MTYKIFISYSTKDLEKVNQIKNILEHSSIDVFVAEYSVLPGQSLPVNIISAIDGCNIFILLWSKNSRASEWVPQEIGIAKAKNKSILPIVLDQDLSLPGFISDLKYLNAYKNPEKALDWLKNNIFKTAEEKQKMDGLFWLGIGAAIFWLSNSGK